MRLHSLTENQSVFIITCYWNIPHIQSVLNYYQRCMSQSYLMEQLLLYGFTIQRQYGQSILAKGNVVRMQKISKTVAWIIKLYCIKIIIIKFSWSNVCNAQINRSWVTFGPKFWGVPFSVKNDIGVCKEWISQTI